jgi:hypothetical protein
MDSASWKSADRQRALADIVRQFGISAAVGAFFGWMISLIVDQAATASQQECANTSSLCFGTAPFEGLLGATLLLIAACWIGFALAGLRPLWAYVPGGLLLFVIVADEYLKNVHGGRLHPAGEFAAVAGACFLVLPLIHRLRRGGSGPEPTDPRRPAAKWRPTPSPNRLVQSAYQQPGAGERDLTRGGEVAGPDLDVQVAPQRDDDEAP